MKRHALLVLVVINGVLAAWLAWLWFTPQGGLRNVHWQPPAAQKTDLSGLLPALPTLLQADTNRFIVLLERPLFSPTRRPPPPPPPPPPPAAAAPVDNFSTARLSGVFEGPGGTGIIIQMAGKNRRLQINQSLEGWTLKAVQGREVTFASGGETRVLQLPRAALNAYTGQPLAPFSESVRAQDAVRAGRANEPPSGSAAGAQQAGAAPEPPKPRAVFGGTRR